MVPMLAHNTLIVCRGTTRVVLHSALGSLEASASDEMGAAVLCSQTNVRLALCQLTLSLPISILRDSLTLSVSLCPSTLSHLCTNNRRITKGNHLSAGTARVDLVVSCTQGSDPLQQSGGSTPHFPKLCPPSAARGLWVQWDWIVDSDRNQTVTPHTGVPSFDCETSCGLLCPGHGPFSPCHLTGSCPHHSAG